MEEDDLEIAIKVLVVGNGGVGKSSLIQRYCKGTYTDGYKKTIGVDFLEKSLELDFATFLFSCSDVHDGCIQYVSRWNSRQSLRKFNTVVIETP